MLEPTQDHRGAQLLRRILAGTPATESGLTHIAELPARSAEFGSWPDWVPAEVRAAELAAGIRAPWSHQVRAAQLVRDGRNVVIATGTASGKSLAYQLPICASLLADPKASALYLAPTKALASDQLRALRGLSPAAVRAATFDGDTPILERDWVRAHANWVFTNPDMLHRSILPAHDRWARLFRGLSHVVIDECHTYRGVFGSHVALLLRRLRRIATHYGAEPVFVLASATSADPQRSAERLLGAPVAAVTADGAPRGARTVALWEPPLLEEPSGYDGAPVRRSAGAQAARIMAELVTQKAPTLAFVG
ncbi:MAG: DEAD/DEAH box helicase, partial [Sciscionella sp.]